LIVFDASAAVLALLNDDDARRTLGAELVGIPHLADSEVAQTLRSQVHRGKITAIEGRTALQTWSVLGLWRVGVGGLLMRMWDLRANLSAYDATYVALAESLDCPLVTADSRLATAPGPTCPMLVVRR